MLARLKGDASFGRAAAGAAVALASDQNLFVELKILLGNSLRGEPLDVLESRLDESLSIARVRADPVDRRPNFADAFRIDQAGADAGDFAHRQPIARDKRPADRVRFEDRDAESFVERHERHDVAQLVLPHELVSRQIDVVLVVDLRFAAVVARHRGRWLRPRRACTASPRRRR